MSCGVLDGLSRHCTNSLGNIPLPILSLSERLGQQELMSAPRLLLFWGVVCLFIFWGGTEVQPTATFAGSSRYLFFYKLRDSTENRVASDIHSMREADRIRMRSTWTSKNGGQRQEPSGVQGLTPSNLYLLFWTGVWSSTGSQTQDDTLHPCPFLWDWHWKLRFNLSQADWNSPVVNFDGNWMFWKPWHDSSSQAGAGPCSFSNDLINCPGSWSWGSWKGFGLNG